MFWDIANKNKILEESIKYIANSLIKNLHNNEASTIGVSSSINCSKIKLSVCKALGEKVKLKGLNVKIIDLEEKNSDIKNLKNLITEEKSKNNIIFVNIPPIPLFADSIEYSKICDRIVLLERYRYSSYKNYEETLARIKAHGVKLEGVITYGN